MNKYYYVMKKYEVLEDNGGGLTLFVFGKDGKVEYAHSDFEYVHESLLSSIEALRNGDDPVREWDGNMEDPQAVYDSFTEEARKNGGWELVADNDGIYPKNMGCNAMYEFGIKEM